MALIVCLAQLNLVVGDVPGNAQKILLAAQQAQQQGADLLVTPELALCAYPPEDLLLRPAFLQDCDDALKQLALQTAPMKGFYLLVGHPARAHVDGREVLHNAASMLHEGRVLQRFDKRALPDYQVFDEPRYFVPGHASLVAELQARDGGQHSLGVLICEDAWHDPLAQQAKQAGAQALLVLNASPFHQGKGGEREAIMRQRVLGTGLPLLYAHCVGGQDELVFEGRSFALDALGRVAGRAPSFVEHLLVVRLHADRPGRYRLEAEVAAEPEPLADLWQALVLGVRDYVNKNRFPGALLGLSGGIDSALVLAVAVDALGAERVQTLMMPSPYTADMSWLDAREMADRLRVGHSELAIGPHFEVFKHSLAPLFVGLAEDTTEENLQARIRGTLLMALSNKGGKIVLTTGNKSELATGYCTLYGDMAGGFAVIKDLLKTQVFALARWRNENDPFGTGSNPIPERIITRPPSAELRPEQTDQDSLPPYPVLDDIIERCMEGNQSTEEIVAAGHEAALVERVLRLIRINEYKRRQAPIGIRLSQRAFGKDWRYPITNAYRY